MKKYIFIVLALSLFTACVNQRSVNKWIRNHPDKVFTKITERIITKTDTFRIPIKGDTISKFIVSNHIDTFFKEGRAEVKLIFRTDTVNRTSRVYLKAICKPDTITLFDTDTVTITRSTEIGVLAPRWYDSFWNWLLIIIGGAAVAYINYRYRNANT